MRTVALCLALVGLSACAPSVSRGNEKGGELDNIIGVQHQEALATADEHCRRYGRVARITDTDVLKTISFDCVIPEDSQ